MHTKELHYGIGFWLMLQIISGLYWQGLNGTWLLDDQANLAPLKHITDDSIREWGQFIFEGHAGASGRPLALLTFASQFYCWPTEVWAFKYVNLMVHLLNGCLIFWLVYLLSAFIAYQHRLLLALLTATVWLAHPLQVSTVLYTVQRMTQLTTLWTLVGLISYLKGRQAFIAQHTAWKNYIWISVAVGISLLFAVLSKENGILLCLYILILEITILARVPQPPYWHYWLSVFVYVPLLLLIGYLSLNWSHFVQSYEIREFSLDERLLTQARILLDYLAKLTLLNTQDLGLFHDDYSYSQGLLNPPTTLLALLIIFFSLMGALWYRRRYPLFALALLWFLGGHSLESTFLPLALYFEHRNYLPSLGILFGLVWGWLYLTQRMSNLRLIMNSLGIIIVLLLALLTSSQTQLWGQPLKQAIVWAQQKPNSRFAQSHAAQLLVNRGHYEAAQTLYQTMVKRFPKDTGPYIIWLTAACQHRQITAPPLQQVWPQLEQAHVDTATISSLMSLLIPYQPCASLSLQQLEALLTLLIQHSQQQPYYLSYLYYLNATLAAQQHQFTTAIRRIEQALALTTARPLFRLKKLSWLIQANQLQQASDYLKQTRQQWSQFKTYLYAKELNLLATQLKIKQEMHLLLPKQ